MINLDCSPAEAAAALEAYLMKSGWVLGERLRMARIGSDPTYPRKIGSPLERNNAAEKIRECLGFYMVTVYVKSTVKGG